MTATPKNLVDALSSEDRRAFCVPIASDVLARPQHFPSVPEALLSPSDGVVEDAPCLTVSIADFLNELGDQQDLPHEALRLHAVGRGKITYRPTLGPLQKCLVLTLAPIWPAAVPKARWLERWLEAGRVPRTVIYENVDPIHLRELLESLSPDPPAPPNPDQPRGVGILMPSRVSRDDSDDDSKAAFIDDFMNGVEGAALIVQPGACIGKIGAAVTPQTYRVRFHVRYEGDTVADPRPMHPRELFNLLFGDDSPEAWGNALMKSIHAAGTSDTALPRSRRMLLRPPLRTHFRVIWEARQELTETSAADGHEARWAANGLLGQDLLTNTVPSFDRTNTYEGLYKCNLFVGEMLLRSGFRVRMRRNPATSGQPETVYYYLSNRVVGEARDVSLPLGGVGVLATEGELAWGRRWDGRLVQLAGLELVAEINRLMEEEGRAFYLVQEKRCVPIGACHGHELLLERVETTRPPGDPFGDRPTVVFETKGLASRGTRIGLQWIRAAVIEAPADGLFRRVRNVVPEWPDFFANTVRKSRNNDLLLIEAVPGADPSTDRGMAELCILHQAGP